MAVLVLLAIPAGPLHAQPAERVGDFSVEVRTASGTGQDSSFAMLWPGGGYLSPDVSMGPLSLACGRESAGLGVAVMLPAYGSAGDTLPVRMRLGQGEPETLVLEGHDGIVWYLRDADVAPFLGRALTADSLVVEMLEAPRSGAPSRYAYALAGLDTTLSRLGCTVAPPAPGLQAGRRILQGMLSGAVERSETVPPRARSPRDLIRYLEANYPRELWDARVEGEVSVKFQVMEDGSVDPASIQIVRSTHAAFEAAAGHAVRRICFDPATAYGRPVKVWIEQPIRFVPPRRRPRARLDDSPPPACPPPRAW
jgi:TonB family protein